MCPESNEGDSTSLIEKVNAEFISKLRDVGDIDSKIVDTLENHLKKGSKITLEFLLQLIEGG